VDIGDRLERDTCTCTPSHLQGAVIPERFDAGGRACWIATASDGYGCLCAVVCCR
jgi:hypothetical protein